MKNKYKITVFFLLFYTAAILLLANGQLIGVHWSFSEKTAFGRMLLHPELVQIHLLFSASLLFYSCSRTKKHTSLCLALHWQPVFTVHTSPTFL